MKNDPIVTVLIHHVTAKQAYQIRGIAESSLTAKKALEEQAIKLNYRAHNYRTQLRATSRKLAKAEKYRSPPS